MLEIDRERCEYILRFLETASKLSPEAQVRLMKKLHYHFFGNPLEILQIRLMKRWGARLENDEGDPVSR